MPATPPPEPRCGHCDYIVRGLIGDTCPECGSDLRTVGVRQGRHGRQRHARGRLALWIAWTALVLFGGMCLWQAAKPHLPRRHIVGVEQYLREPASGAYGGLTVRVEGRGDAYPLPPQDLRLLIALNPRDHRDARFDGTPRLEVDPATWTATAVDPAAGRRDPIPGPFGPATLRQWMRTVGVTAAAADGPAVRTEADAVDALARDLVTRQRASSARPVCFGSNGYSTGIGDVTPTWLSATSLTLWAVTEAAGTVLILRLTASRRRAA